MSFHLKNLQLIERKADLAALPEGKVLKKSFLQGRYNSFSFFVLIIRQMPSRKCPLKEISRAWFGYTI